MFDFCGVADFLPDYSINVLSCRDNKTDGQLNRRKMAFNWTRAFAQALNSGIPEAKPKE